MAEPNLTAEGPDSVVVGDEIIARLPSSGGMPLQKHVVRPPNRVDEGVLQARPDDGHRACDAPAV